MNCPSCRKSYALCRCSRYCDECEGITNHTGAMHREAEQEERTISEQAVIDIAREFLGEQR